MSKTMMGDDGDGDDDNNDDVFIHSEELIRHMKNLLLNFNTFERFFVYSLLQST